MEADQVTQQLIPVMHVDRLAIALPLATPPELTNTTVLFTVSRPTA